LNKVILTGNLTRDPEVKYSASGMTYVRVGIAVNRFSKEKNAVDFFNLVAFDKTAEFLGKYFAKGSKILIDGQLRTNSYTDKDGVKRTSTEIIVDRIEFASSKKDSDDQRDRSDDSSYRRNSTTEYDVPSPMEDVPF